MRVATALLVILVFEACVPAPEPVVDTTAVRAEVIERVEGYVQAIRELDQDYIESFWADVDAFTVAGDGTLTIGYDSWLASIRELLATVASVEYVEIENPRVHVFGPDAASYAMSYRWRFNMTDGSTLSAEGSWMYVLGPVDGEWRVIHSAGSHVYS